MDPPTFAVSWTDLLGAARAVLEANQKLLAGVTSNTIRQRSAPFSCAPGGTRTPNRFLRTELLFH